MPKVIRVEIEYDNGDVYRATGDATHQVWLDFLSAKPTETQYASAFAFEKVEKPRIRQMIDPLTQKQHKHNPACSRMGCVEAKP
jgi:hypothetical protein